MINTLPVRPSLRRPWGRQPGRGKGRANGARFFLFPPRSVTRRRSYYYYCFILDGIYRDGQRTWLRDDRRRMLQHLRRWRRHVLLGRHHVRGSGGGVRLHAAARGDVRCGRVGAGRRN